MSPATIAGWVIKRVPGNVLVYIGAGLLIALGLSLIALSVQSARLDAAKVAAEAYKQQAELAASELIGARESAGAWEALALDLRGKLNASMAEAATRAAQDAERVKRATAAQRDADAVLAAWLERYANATRAAECAAIERMRVCEVE